MARRSWKKVHPTSLRHAMELCIEHAKDKRNLSVDRIADLMGQSNKWNIYKWMENGRMPVNLITPFEHVCGIDFMTQYLATSSHKILVDIPLGKGCQANDINELQASFTDSISLLIRFYQDGTDIDKTVASLTTVMKNIAYHRENANKAESPELDLFGGDK